jgi:glyoxylase I family protein
MSSLVFSHMAMCCRDPEAVERFYSKHFGFKRARVYAPGKDQVVMIKSDGIYLEIFPATKEAPASPVGGAGPEYVGWRHLAFLVTDLDGKLAEMGGDAKVTLGPLDMSEFIPNMRVVWLADPEGNIVELNQGYVDEANPPALEDERTAGSSQEPNHA